jgi:hypothetical protein
LIRLFNTGIGVAKPSQRIKLVKIPNQVFAPVSEANDGNTYLSLLATNGH